MASSRTSSLAYPTAVSSRVSGRRSSSYTHQSASGPSSPGAPIVGANRPPTKVISFGGARTIRGAMSRYSDGSRSRQT